VFIFKFEYVEVLNSTQKKWKKSCRPIRAKSTTANTSTTDLRCSTSVVLVKAVHELTLDGISPRKPVACYCGSDFKLEGITWRVFTGAKSTCILAGCLHMSAVTIIVETGFLVILEQPITHFFITIIIFESENRIISATYNGRHCRRLAWEFGRCLGWG
jgi:hypothetical protein